MPLFPLALIPVALVLLRSPPVATQPAPPTTTQAVRDPTWDAVFTRTDGWTCGDIAHSIDLADGRTLWLFGDSGIGPVRQSRHVRDPFAFIRNTVAWHTSASPPGPPPTDLRFAFGPAGKDRKATSWLDPAPGLWPDGTWYWLMGDGAVVTGSGTERASPRLVVFATALGPSGNPDGMWNFRRIGGVILVVSNPADPPDRWRVEQRKNPIVQPVAGYNEPPRQSDDWGASVILWRETPSDPLRAYIFGVRTPASGPHALLVARADPAQLDEPQRWQFFDGRGWSSRAADAAPIAKDLPDEFTIEPLTRDVGLELVMIHSEPLFGRRIMARASLRPEGPWPDPAPIFTVPDPAADQRLTTYAAKGHARLSAPGELSVSYIVNSRDLDQVLDDASLYRPRFIRVPLGALPSAPASPNRKP